MMIGGGVGYQRNVKFPVEAIDESVSFPPTTAEKMEPDSADRLWAIDGAGVELRQKRMNPESFLDAVSAVCQQILTRVSAHVRFVVQCPSLVKAEHKPTKGIRCNLPTFSPP